MTTKEINLTYRPRRVFTQFHDRDKRFTVIVAHRRCGKTVACVNDLVARALNTVKKDANYGYVCPTFSQSKKVAWKYLKAAVAPIPGVKCNESECSVKFPNSSQITLYGADNPDALRGLYFDGIVLDEYGDMKGRVYSEVVRPAIADRKGWVVFIGTPRGKNSFYEKREQARINKTGKWLYVELKASETGILSDEELQDMKEEMDEDEIAAELECSFDAAIKGSYYGKWMTRITENNQITHVPVLEHLPVNSAWDLGRTDATAIWFYQIYGGEVRIVDYFETSQEDIEEIWEQVSDLGYQLGTAWLPEDAKYKTILNPRSVVEILRTKIADCRIVPDAKRRDGINTVRRILPYCYFDADNCYTGIERLKNYQRIYDADRQVFADAPLHDINSHGADAFRHLALSIADAEIASSAPRKPEEKKSRFERDKERQSKLSTQTPVINNLTAYSRPAIVTTLTLDELFALQDMRYTEYKRI